MLIKYNLPFLWARQTRSKTLSPLSSIPLFPTLFHLFYCSPHRGTLSCSPVLVPLAQGSVALAPPKPNEEICCVTFLILLQGLASKELSALWRQNISFSCTKSPGSGGTDCVRVRKMKIRAESESFPLSQLYLMSFPTWRNGGTERTNPLPRLCSLEDPGNGTSATGKLCPCLFEEVVIC